MLRYRSVQPESESKTCRESRICSQTKTSTEPSAKPLPFSADLSVDNTVLHFCEAACFLGSLRFPLVLASPFLATVWQILASYRFKTFVVQVVQKLSCYVFSTRKRF